MKKVAVEINLQMSKSATQEGLSSGTVIIVFDDDRRLSLDFGLTTTHVEGNTYYVGLYDGDTWCPEDGSDEDGLEDFDKTDFSHIKEVEELFLQGEDENYVEGQSVVHATGVIVDVVSGETIANLSDKEFANTDFGEFYPNKIGSSAKEVA